MEKYSDLLEVCGFKKMLSEENKQEAVLAVKSYFLFIRLLPSLLQCIDGKCL